MKKNILFLFSGILLFTACNQGPKYTISGKIQGDAEGEKIYLKQNNNLRPGDAIDSTTVKNGTFKFSGKTDSPDLYYITSSKGNGNVLLFVENDTPIAVTFDVNNPEKNVADGSPLNNLLKKYNAGKKEFQDEIADIRKKAREASQNKTLTPELEEEINKAYDDATQRYNNFQLNFVKQNDTSLVSAYVLRSAINGLPINEVEQQIQKLEQNIGKSELIESSKKQLEIIKRVDIGQKFVDLQMPNPTGKNISLSDYAGKGKYVLIDFWAAWCPPCRKEMPNIVSLYNKYKNKDFEIVGVSFDRNEEEWTKGLEELGMTWPQMSDLKYWQSEGARLYNVRSIPHTILLDKEGRIMAKNLTGETLQNKLKELLD